MLCNILNTQFVFGFFVLIPNFISNGWRLRTQKKGFAILKIKKVSPFKVFEVKNIFYSDAQAGK